MITLRDLTNSKECRDAFNRHQALEKAPVREIAKSHERLLGEIQASASQLIDTRDVLAFCLRLLNPLAEEILQDFNIPPDELRNPRLVMGRCFLAGATLSGAQLQGVNLHEAQLQGADLTLSGLQRARLDNAQLQGAFMNGARSQHSHLQGAQLCMVSLCGAQLQGAQMLQVNMQSANLKEADLQRATLGASRLRGTDFSQARLQDAIFSRAELQGANLSEAQLQGASFLWTELQGAKLCRAHLQGTRLYGAIGSTDGDANCRSADFTDANWWDAEFVWGENTDNNLRDWLERSFPNPNEKATTPQTTQQPQAVVRDSQARPSAKTTTKHESGGPGNRSTKGS